MVEVLDGLGVEQIRDIRERGHPTQVYLVYGTEWWLYVLDRIAEDPQRLLVALADAAATGASSGMG